MTQDGFSRWPQRPGLTALGPATDRLEYLRTASSLNTNIASPVAPSVRSVSTMNRNRINNSKHDDCNNVGNQLANCKSLNWFWKMEFANVVVVAEWRVRRLTERPRTLKCSCRPWNEFCECNTNAVSLGNKQGYEILWIDDSCKRKVLLDHSCLPRAPCSIRSNQHHTESFRFNCVLTLCSFSKQST